MTDTSLKAKLFSDLNWLLILCNIALFVWACSIPLYWQQPELFYHGFFWSMNGTTDYHLQTGLRWSDFLKPLDPLRVDGPLRFRQFSYLTEMLTFKFWQYFSVAYASNCNVVFFHLLTVFALWKLTYKLTQSKSSAWAAALLALNSGIAIATVMFPFRNAKLLVVTLFLFAWHILANSKTSLDKAGWGRVAGFFFIGLLAAFTDEIAFFVFPLLFFYLYLRDGKKGVFNKRIIIGFCVNAALFIALVLFIKEYTSHNPNYSVERHTIPDHLRNLTAYFSQPIATVRDLAKAFFAFFLQRNFGYWDFSILGVSAFLSFTALIFMITKKLLPFEKKLAAAILVMVLIKALLLPHNFGVHKISMPEGTVFPSLLFFQHYYAYCETVIFGLIFGILLAKGITDSRKFTLTLLCITIISLSNVYHLKSGPQNALEAVNRHLPVPKMAMKDLLRVKWYLTQKNLRPFYLSFPTINADYIHGTWADTENISPNVYTDFILVNYLRPIEKGDAIISLKNPSAPAFPPEDELTNAATFLDIFTEESLDLKRLREGKELSVLSPREAARSKPGAHSETLTQPIKEAVFFIKGRAQYQFKINDQTFTGEQSYGNSYEMFRFPIPPEMKTSIRLELMVVPADKSREAYFVGPFGF